MQMTNIDSERNTIPTRQPVPKIILPTNAQENEPTRSSALFPVTPAFTIPTKPQQSQQSTRPHTLSANHPAASPMGSPVPNSTSPLLSKMGYGTDPAATASRQENRCFRHCKRGGLQLVFVGIAFVQTVVACCLIWWIGYSAQISTVESFRGQLRDSILSNCANQINWKFSSTLRVAHALHMATDQRFPDFGDVLTVTDRAGWAADLSSLNAMFPQVGHFGFMNKHSFSAKTTRPTSLAETAVLSQAGLTAVFLVEPTEFNQTDLQVEGYITTPIHPFPEYKSPVNVPHGEILNSDSPEEIRQWLGPVRSVTPFGIQDRGLWLAAEQLATIGQSGGWSDPIAVTSTSRAAGFVGFAAFSSSINKVTGLVDWLAFNVISAADFEPFLSSLRVGPNGKVYMMRPAGGLVATSDPGLTLILANTTQEIDLFTSTDPFLQELLPILIRENLVTTQPTDLTNVTQVVPYRENILEEHFFVGGEWWLMQAQMTSNSTTGLPFFIVVATRDSDFDGDLRSSMFTTIWLGIIVVLSSIILSALVTSCVTRPLMRVVKFMERGSKVISMPRGEDQREQLHQLCDDWSQDTHAMSILDSHAETLSRESQIEGSKAKKCRSDSFCCFNVGRSLREVDLMHRSFGSMLFSLASYDELEAINQAKRQFIRYIFHEVRVPFNAIVLGIEQMALELKVHIKSNPHCVSLSPCLDTMAIVHEQGEIVSRILNDVLSMQKIEDGALTLDLTPFDIEKMIRVALHGFRVPCTDKRLKVTMSCQPLDQLIEQARDIIPLLATHPNIHLGTPNGEPASSPIDVPGTWKAHIEADPYRIRQALANFLSNAVKFSRVEGTIHVTLEYSDFVPCCEPMRIVVSPVGSVAASNSRAKRESVSLDPSPQPSPRPRKQSVDDSTIDGLEEIKLDSPEGTEDIIEADSEFSGRYIGSVSVTVRVRDSGVGLSPENVGRMFQQYSQVSANKNQQGGGTGLGLSISKSIVELHGGSIGCTSEAGVGSEFFFTIPNTRVILDKQDLDTSLAENDGGVRSLSLQEALKDSRDSSPLATSLGGHLRSASDQAFLASLPAPLPVGVSELKRLMHARSASSTPRQSNRSLPSSTQMVSRTLFTNDEASAVSSARMTNRQLEVAPVAIDVPHEDEHPPTLHSRTIAAGPISPASKTVTANTCSPPESTPARTSVEPVSAIADEAAQRLWSNDAGAYGSQSLLTRNDSSLGSAISTPQNLSPESHHETLQSRHTSTSLAQTTGNTSPPLINTAPSTNRTIAASAASGSANRRSLPPSPHIGHESDGSRTSMPLAPVWSGSPLSRPRQVPSAVPSLPVQVSSAAEDVRFPSPVIRSSHQSMSTSIPALTSLTSSHKASLTGKQRHATAKPNPVRIGARVLVAEDSLPNRKLLLSILQHMKLVAVGVEDGQQCVDLFPVNENNNNGTNDTTTATPNNGDVPSSVSSPSVPFDIVIMDGNMPIMGGVEACKILRSRGVTIPILALTGNALAEDVAAFIDAGANSVLTKPINRSQLVAALHQHLPPNTR